VQPREAEADQRVAEYRDMLVRFEDLIDAGMLSRARRRWPRHRVAETA
jgi:hypothetical protein